MSTEGSTKAIVAALLANLGIAVAKFIAFFITSSSSMLAEAIHSVADSSNQGLLLLGGARARRTATPEHPFGFGRERYFWSFVVALVLFTLGGVFALFEGVEKLRHPHDVGDLKVAVGVLVVAILVEALSLRTAVIESRHAKGAASWWHFVRTSRSPELPVVLLEDIGAMVGLVVALVAVSAAGVTGNPALDAVGTISIGALLLAIAVFLMIEMKSLLIGERALPREEQAIQAALESHPNVRRVIHMRTQHLGPEDLLVGVKVALEAELDLGQVAATINDAEAAVRRAVPTARIVYVEPDVLAMGSDHGMSATDRPAAE
jgi:cation diffusion facilitator family transporter